ncbi:MAG: prolipoprotein diacylglyceryl transferase [Bacteroidaceae bacterium]
MLISLLSAYPNGINFDGFTYPGEHDAVVTFYALCIVTGALVAWFLASWKAHKRGYPWDTYDIVFLWAFPAGIVGARIWYVIAQWETEFSNRAFIDVFKTWEGGMAIQGGVILGAIAGLLVIKFRRKGLSVFDAADFAVPGILIAQAMGRWGNFLNQEVYGLIVDQSTWSFVPDWILNNMIIGGSFRVPLFLLEGVINIAGYYVLTHFIKIAFNKFYKSGDILFSYFAWYGIVRLILEPLRDAEFNMGVGSDLKAVTMAIIFIVGGVLGVVINHIVRMRIDKKTSKSASVR